MKNISEEITNILAEAFRKVRNICEVEFCHVPYIMAGLVNESTVIMTDHHDNTLDITYYERSERCKQPQL